MIGKVALPAGYRLIRLDTTDSTNAEALRRIGGGEQPGAVIWALRQTAGRGRRGRRWRSPEGNLYATLVAAVPAGRIAGQLAFVAALAAGEAVCAVLPEQHRLAYKWPNDLMLDGRKLGGILIEGGETPARSPLLAVGVGINVASAPQGAASLRDAGTRLPVEVLLSALCGAFDRWFTVWSERGFLPVRAAWLAQAGGLGEPLEVRLPDGTVLPGVFCDMDDQGTMVLRQDDGVTRRIAAGEVFFAAA